MTLRNGYSTLAANAESGSARSERQPAKSVAPVSDTGATLTIKQVGMTGLEPATSRPPDACANQLRYIPLH